MNSKTRNNLTLFWKISLFVPLLLFLPSLALNSDGILLISLKHSILGDPLSVLENWNYGDETPCSWKGVTCSKLDNANGFFPDTFRVTSLALPESQLLGSIPEELGMIQHLQYLDLSSNFFNGSLPISIFNASELQILSLSNNVISGGLPESIAGLKSLQLLNLSDNALAGNIPKNLTSLQNLTVISLRSNYFSGNIPSNFTSIEVLDLSSNLLNGSLPINFDGEKLQYLNFSYNKISSPIPSEFAKRIPTNATIDLSFNNLTGAIPQTLSLLNQKMESFTGNENLCGKPLKHLCSIPSSLTTQPNISSSSSSSPAIAAIPKTIGSIPATPSIVPPNGTQSSQPQSTMKPITIAAIAIGDLIGISILGLVILYIYHQRKRKSSNSKILEITKKPQIESEQNNQNPKKTSSSVLFCLANKGEETSETATSSDNDEQKEVSGAVESKKKGVLVTIDGETEIELETLLKASAFIIGANGGSIVYKAVLENGTAMAVRRIGENGIERMRDFENQVRVIGKIKHQNLVKILGFYWGEDEKLIIYEFVSNGCLAASIHRKPSSSSASSSQNTTHLSFDLRLKIARGIARGLAFIHDKKQVHGNIKPTNILFNSDMEPLINDFGLDKLTFSSSSNKIIVSSAGSARNLGSHRSTPTRDHHQDHSGIGSSPGSGVNVVASVYQAPESLKSLKPSPKWDVYSFGVILLELLSGRAMSERELNQWNVGLMTEDESRMKKMTDMTIRGEVEGREDAVMACFRLGFSCVCFVPQKRPSMKEALQVLEKIPTIGSR